MTPPDDTLTDAPALGGTCATCHWWDAYTEGEFVGKGECVLPNALGAPIDLAVFVTVGSDGLAVGELVTPPDWYCKGYEPHKETTP